MSFLHPSSWEQVTHSVTLSHWNNLVISRQLVIEPFQSNRVDLSEMQRMPALCFENFPWHYSVIFCLYCVQ